MSDYTFLLNLALAISIECSVAFFYGLKDKYNQVVILCTNCITNVPLTFIISLIHLFIPIIYFPLTLTFLEIIVFIVERLIYKKCLKTDKNPTNISFFLNLISYTIGIVIYVIIN